MLKDIVAVRVLDQYRLDIRFEDGLQGTVDMAKLVPFKGVFTPLADPDFFKQVRVNPELGTVVWPNGADLDPDVFYAEVSGKPVSVTPRPTPTH